VKKNNPGKYSIDFLFCLILGLGSTGIGFYLPDTYVGDCLRNFPFQLILLVLIGVFSYKKIGWPLSVSCVLVGILLNCLIIKNAVPVLSSPVSSTCPPIKIGSFNLLSKSHGYASVSSQITEQDFDLIVFQELNSKWLDGLKDALAKYPEKMVNLRPDDFGSGIFTRLPVLAKQMVKLAVNDPGQPMATITQCNRTISVLGIHTPPPSFPAQWRIRNQELSKLAEMAQDKSKRWIMLGDFNVTPYSNFYRQFSISSGLSDARSVLGLLPSWPTFVPPLWIPIDQLFYSGSLELVEIKRGNLSGSDHWPIVATFR